MIRFLIIREYGEYKSKQSKVVKLLTVPGAPTLFKSLSPELERKVVEQQETLTFN